MNILVTGASKGIGRAIAEELAQTEQVFVTARNEANLKSLNVAGYCVCDLSQSIDGLIDFIKANNIDVLVNNAGITRDMLLMRMKESDFTDVINVEFTAKIESEFDEIAEGKEEWKKMLREFYGPFEKELEKVEKELEHVELVEEVSDVPCEKCGRMMVYKYGRYGKFLACPGYPECKNAKPIIETIDVPCPKCGATVQVRKTKRKRNYYICENNPESCDYISWNKPKPGEKWNPEEAEEIKAETKKKTTRKTAKKKAKKV